MKTRHLIFGAVFFGFFLFGSLNVITDGGFEHAVVSQIPGHAVDPSKAEPRIEAESRIDVAAGEEGRTTVKLWNVKEISYQDPTFSENVNRSWITLEKSLRPPATGAAQSLPPYWTYDHVEPYVSLELEFNVSKSTEPGNYTYTIEAWESEDIAETPATANITLEVTE